MSGELSAKEDPRLLMRQAKEGNGEAFGKLYELYFVPIFRYIYFRVQNKEETEDLTQTVFVKVYKAIPRFQERDASPLAYFFAVARNTMTDYWRKKKPMPLYESFEHTLHDDASENPLSLSEQHDKERGVMGALNQLGEEQREVILLKFMNGFRNREIAALLDKSEEAVRQLQCRALKKLRAELGNSLL